MKEFQEANYARVRRRGPRRSSSDIARAKIQGKRHRVSCCPRATCKMGLNSVRSELWFCIDCLTLDYKIVTFFLSSNYWFMHPLILTLHLSRENLDHW